MSPKSNYFLLIKNNRLQTIESLINPFVYSSKDKLELLRVKQQLELIYLKQIPIHFHFDHLEKDCNEEIKHFDKYLLNNFNFSFLKDGFDHNQKDVSGQILYTKKFPAHLSDVELLTIQKEMGKYHFKAIEQEPNDKAIIVLNPWTIENPLRDGEIFQLEKYFNSKQEAQQYIDKIIEVHFDMDGSFLTLGEVTENELTDKTREILSSKDDIQFKSRHEPNGQRFFSTHNLSDIPNGLNILLELYDSIGKKPYEIVELK